MEHMSLEQNQSGDDPRNPPGIVIASGWEAPRRPAITAFIWGGKVAPVPAIPYGRASAA
jgi:hypothetical protein